MTTDSQAWNRRARTFGRITLERTYDPVLIKSIFGHRRVFARMHDDFSPTREEWEPIVHEATIGYMVAYEDDDPVGMFMVSAHNPVLFEIHEAFLPSAWGDLAREATLKMREWIWQNTPCQRIIGNIVESNRLALKFALDAGMTIYGVNPRSFMKCGKLRDQIMVGISRPEGV